MESTEHSENRKARTQVLLPRAMTFSYKIILGVLRYDWFYLVGNIFGWLMLAFPNTQFTLTYTGAS